tara:strand:+ start:14127 stop:14798 length:672 start_codon:yes stop_codon:yes gene_type:complete
MKKKEVKIEIVSDIVCPWCVIGYKNLKKAIPKLDKEMLITINWRPYELHPEIPKEGYDKNLYAAQKFGSSDRSLYFNEIKKLGDSLDFSFNFSKTKRIPNTFNAHRLIWLSEKDDRQCEMSEALFYAYFTEGRDVGCIETLSKIANKLGYDETYINKFLLSKEGGKEVAKLEMSAMQKSISAVPTYIINKKYLIHGGQEPETFISFLRRVQEKETIIDNAKNS